MQAVVVAQTGDPEQLHFQEVRTPQPKAGEALVRVQAAGVNFLDVYFRRGTYQAELPFIPGLEFAGTIESIDDATSTLQPGDRVAGFVRTGAYAQFVVAPVKRLVPIPATTPVDHAMALFQGITAHFLTESVHAVCAGETVLVFSAAGGVGGMLVQFAKARGATVIGVASTPEKAQAVKDAGADFVVSPADVANAVRNIVPAGANVVFDASGNETFEAVLDSTAKRGHIVLYGASSGTEPRAILPKELHLRGSLTLSYPSSVDYTHTHEELVMRAQAVLKMLETGTLKIVAATPIPLRDAIKAHRLLESRANVGKLYLTVN